MKYFSLFFSLIVLLSCSGDLDFDQADSLDIQPVIELDMLFFNIHKPNLIDGQGNFRNVIQDTVDFGFFEDGKVRDGFVKADITVGFKNTFERDFYTEYFFIDENDQPVEEGNFTIAAADTQHPEVNGEYVFSFDKQVNPDFVNFRKIVIQVTVTPDTFPVEEKQLHVQTKGTFYLNTVIE
jgi:hypothetical protein